MPTHHALLLAAMMLSVLALVIDRPGAASGLGLLAGVTLVLAIALTPVSA